MTIGAKGKDSHLPPHTNHLVGFVFNFGYVCVCVCVCVILKLVFTLRLALAFACQLAIELAAIRVTYQLR